MRTLVPLMLLLGLLAGCAESEKPTVLQPFQLPDGTTVGGAVWAKDGMTMSTRTAALFRCPHEPSKNPCKPLAAGTVAGAGHEQVIGAAVQASLAATLGSVLLPKPSGGNLLLAPETLVQTNITPAK